MRDTRDKIGFTLVEMMVAVGIVAFLAVLSVVILVGSLHNYSAKRLGDGVTLTFQSLVPRYLCPPAACAWVLRLHQKDKVARQGDPRTCRHHSGRDRKWV